MSECGLCDRDHVRGSAECPARRVGRVVANKYELTQLLGVGGMGAVYRATHMTLRSDVAIKMLHPRAAAHAETLQRFLGEARRIVSIRHRNLVAIQDLGTDADGSVYLEMEILEGRSFESLVAPPPIAFERAVELISQALDGLGAVHAHQIVHRDIKPGNLFVLTDGRGNDLVKVLDFGIAKGTTEVGLTSTHTLLGTPLYMSPEQCRESRGVDLRSDLYSLGAVLFELLALRPPVEGSTVTEVIVNVAQGDIHRDVSVFRHDVPAWLNAIVARSLAHDPDQRFQSAEEMRSALNEGLAAWRSKRDLAASPTALAPIASAAVAGKDRSPIARTRVEEPSPPTSDAAATRSPMPLGVGGASLVLLLCVGIGSWIATRDETPPPPPPESTGAAAVAQPPPDEMQESHPGMVRIEGGESERGTRSDEVDAILARCSACSRTSVEREVPSLIVFLSPFFIDATEVTNDAFARWLTSRRTTVTEGRFVLEDDALLADLEPPFAGIVGENGAFVARPGAERRPVAQVTWRGAMLYCRSLGLRLPTESEWEVAARGVERRPYPWGADDPTCSSATFGRSPSEPICGGPTGPSVVGETLMDRTPSGIFDLAGNVAEWTLAPFSERPSCGSPCRDPDVAFEDVTSTAARTVRGGSWAEPAVALRAAGRTMLDPGDARAFLGFRCAVSQHAMEENP